jgi:prolyl oligopeptidase
MIRTKSATWVWLSVVAGATATGAPLSDVPSPCRPVTNVYHSVAVSDPYQWLEDAAAAEVRDWTRQQNDRTRAYFQRLPYVAGLREQLTALRGEESARYSGLQSAAGRVFALRFKPPAQQPILIELNAVDPPALRRVVFDPNAWDTNGTTAIDWYRVSHDGRLVAVSLSTGGSEEGVLHFFETQTGRKLADVIPRVQFPTAGGSVAWDADHRAVFYTRYPAPGERPEADSRFHQRVWWHRVGTDPGSDRYEAGRDFPRIAEIHLESSPDGRHILAVVANGDGGDFAHYLRVPAGAWQTLSRFEDGWKQAKIGPDNALYVLSRRETPRGEIVRVPLATPDLANGIVCAPQRRASIQDFEPSATGLYVEGLVGGPSELVFYPRGKRRAQVLPTWPVSAVGALHSWSADDLVFSLVSYVQPLAYMGWQPGAMALRRTALYLTSPADFQDIEVLREFARSKDGTRVPVNILKPKSARRDGNNPALLYGYGGYGISLAPNFDSTRRVWFDAGGIYAVANLRGGGEYGAEWHKAGNLTHKQNVFDDFIAVAEHLIRRGYTRPERLAVEGGSNGGLLVGAFLTQRPDLARAVVAHVGIYDMLRVELDPNGQFNITEFGTVKDPDQFRALYAYSPYHRVADGVRYPAVLLATGENDGRVNPAQSRKMAARLQAASSSGQPILLRTTAGAGHGIGTALSERIALQTDVYAFLFDQLGMDAARWQFR